MGPRPLPKYTELAESPVSTPELAEKYPYILNSGLRSMTFFHSANRQIPWLREIRPDPLVEIHPETAKVHGIQEATGSGSSRPGDGSSNGQAERGHQSTSDRAEHGWWYPEIKRPDHGWDLSNINILTDNSPESTDPVMGATTLRVLLCNISRCDDEQGV